MRDSRRGPAQEGMRLNVVRMLRVVVGESDKARGSHTGHPLAAHWALSPRIDRGSRLADVQSFRRSGTYYAPKHPRQFSYLVSTQYYGLHTILYLAHRYTLRMPTSLT